MVEPVPGWRGRKDGQEDCMKLANLNLNQS